MRTTIVTALALAVFSPAGGQTYTIGTFAGAPLPEFSSGLSASLGPIAAVAADASGSIYFTSLSVVFRLEGNGRLTRVAGSGSRGYSGDNGLATEAQLNNPMGVAVDAAGSLYIADYGNNRIRKVSNGVITSIAGTGVAGYSGDSGLATSAQLYGPRGIAVDATGNLYIADTANQRIRKVSNGVMTTIAGTGGAGPLGDSGPATSAQLVSPYGVAVDAAGSLYIADYGGHRIRKVSNGVITTVAGLGFPGYFDADGPATNAPSALLSSPYGIAVDAAGGLYIADSGNHRIRKVSNGVVTTIAGTGVAGYSGDSGLATSAQLYGPYGVAVDAAGSLYIADSGNSRIRKLSAGVITSVAGGGAGGDGGPATSALLVSPRGIAIDATEGVYVADGGSRIRKVSNGTIATIAGTGARGYNGDGGLATSAQLNGAAGVALDATGGLYIADYSNYRIRKVSNGTIATIAGTGAQGYNGDGGPATSALLVSPNGVAVDSAGSLYIADVNDRRIRKVSNGIITTAAGTGVSGSSGDGGPATGAMLTGPLNVVVDSAGGLYIADVGNHRIRKVSNGLITTVAGTGVAGFSGDGGPATDARLNGPAGVALDEQGNLYIADSNNNRIRKVSNGVITTIAGTGAAGYSGDNGLATDAQLSYPLYVATDSAGSVYVSDAGNNRVRVLVPAVFTVSAASFAPAAPLAPAVIAAGYGTNLVSTIEVAPATGSLPTVLAQTSVLVKDSTGVERTAPLWFVSPSQINYYIPAETAWGPATIRIVRGSQTIATGALQIDPVAPGLFTMNANGQGVPAALAIFVKPDATQTWQYVFNTGCQAGSCQPVPIDLGAPADQVFLQLYGTGIRGRSSLAGIGASIGGIYAPVEYAGEVPGMVGLDQVNLRVPRSLAGRGLVDVVLTVDGRPTNRVRVNFR